MISREQVIEALKKVVDPEIGIDIWTLGLVYEIIPQEPKIKVIMTLTSPACPYGPQVIADVKEKIGKINGVKEVEVELTFEPMWEPSEEIKLMLGIM